MNRIAFSTIAAITLIGAGAALAQGPPPAQPPAQPPIEKPAAPPPAAEPVQDNWDKPESRTGPLWDKHVRACQTRYRSYSPKRDAFMGFRGDWVRCRL